MTRMVPANMTACFELIESEMLQGPWVLGDTFSLGDIYLLTIALWLEADEADTSNIPGVLEHRKRMLDLPAVGKVLQVEQELATTN